MVSRIGFQQVARNLELESLKVMRGQTTGKPMVRQGRRNSDPALAGRVVSVELYVWALLWALNSAQG